MVKVLKSSAFLLFCGMGCLSSIRSRSYGACLTSVSKTLTSSKLSS